MSQFHEIEKNVRLLRKAYDQPLLFYVLHCRLRNLLAKYPLKTFTNDMIKLICFSAMPNIVPNQGLEMKIQRLMNILKPNNIFENGSENHDRNEDKFKLIIILYYNLNRPEKYVNHIVLFNLVNNFLGFDNHIDSLIIALLRKIAVTKVFDLETNSKLTVDSFTHMLDKIKNTKISLTNKILSIPCFIEYRHEMFDLNFYEQVTMESQFVIYKYFEAMIFYVKYATTNTFNAMPEYPDFISGIQNMLTNIYTLPENQAVEDASELLMEDDYILKYVEYKYNMAKDKAKFKEKLVEFLYSLQ